MQSGYTTIYIEVNLLSALILLLILSKNSVERQAEKVAFNRVVIATLCILMLDIAWVELDGRPGPVMHALNSIINGCYLSLSGLISYLWYRYTEAKLPESRAPARFAWLTPLPLALLALLCVLSLWTGWFFTIDGQNCYHRGSLHFVQQLIVYGYLVAATARSLYSLRGQHNREKRKELRVVFSFIVLPIIGGLIGSIYVLPTAWPAVALSLLVVYIELQFNQISTDGLTGLNNRRQFDKYLADALAEARADRPVQLILLDVDQFKKINDTYGHLEGDRALTETATLLKEACMQRDAFLARYGGDEFAIVCHCANLPEMARFKYDIRDRFKTRNACADARFPLVLSLGSAEFDPARMANAKQLIQSADEALYRVKAKQRRKES